MEKERATIYDLSRMCNGFDSCDDCPAGHTNCIHLLRENPDKANEIILKWVKEHPVVTRQDEFLKMFPNAPKDKNGIMDLCPNCIDTTIECAHSAKYCDECCKKYWLTEVMEDELCERTAD